MSADDPARAAMPLCELLGITTVTHTAELVELSLEWRADLCTTAGLLHGGVVMALADSAGAMCAFLNLPADAAGTSTIESKTNFLGPVRDGRIVARAKPLHAGGMTVVVETDVLSGDRRVARVTQTQAVLRPRT